MIFELGCDQKLRTESFLLKQVITDDLMKMTMSKAAEPALRIKMVMVVLMMMMMTTMPLAPPLPQSRGQIGDREAAFLL